MDSIKLNEAQIEANLCKVCLHVVQFLTVCEVGHNKVYNLIDGFKDLGKPGGRDINQRLIATVSGVTRSLGWQRLFQNYVRC